MVQIAGTYSHDKNENLKEFILALGIGEDFATKSEGVKSTMEISVNGNEYTVKNVYPDKTTTVTFTLGAEFDDPMPGGEVLKSVAALNGNLIQVVSKKDGVEVGNRTYEFTDTHCIVSMGAKSTNVIAKRHFKRV